MYYKKLIVTGTGRSGTRYASLAFTRAGMKVTHQEVFRSDVGLPGWKPVWKTPDHMGDSSALAAPVVKTFPGDWLILHQIRSPLSVISSLIANNHVPTTAPWEEQRKELKEYARPLPELQDVPDTVSRAALLWVLWNEKVEEVSHQGNYIVHQIELFGLHFFKRIFELMGVKLTRQGMASLQGIPTNAGHGPKVDLLTVEQIADQDIRRRFIAKAAWYGYTL